MAVPKYNEFMPYIMDCLSDGMIHSIHEVRAFCAVTCSLSEDDKKETLPSGAIVYYDRISWAKTYLKKAGLLDSPSRATYRLTEEGMKATKFGTKNVTLEYLQQYESFREFCQKPLKQEKLNNKQAELVKESSPQDMIAEALNTINQNLADELMVEVMKLSDYQFEGLVVKLLIKMGYVSKLNESLFKTKKSGDEGIDGIVTSDRLGFDAIYTQAKQWKQDAVVGRPEIQRFLGALAGQGATKGLYITTAKFSKDAIRYAEKNLQSKIILIDGEKLMQLMIEYNLGVSTTKSFELKRVDYDFFNEDM